MRSGACKEDVARPYLRRAGRDGRHGVVLIGVAQEKAYAWRGWRDGGNDEHPHFEFGRQAIYVNHYYFYIYDRDWGPGFVKTNAYAPYPVWVYLNGHEWAKRQAAQQGFDFRALDNGFAACADAAALAAICARLSYATCKCSSNAGSRCCPRRLPTPSGRATATASASVSSSCQTPASLIARPPAAPGLSRRCATSSASGTPTACRSSSLAKVTRQTPGVFQTKVITRGVAPLIEAHYKRSKVEQCFKDGRALRTETTVNDPYDFGVNRTLTADTWSALLQLGHNINARLMTAQLQACQCAPDPTALQAIVLPSTHDGLPAPGLRFGDPRVMALLACLCHWGHLSTG